MKKIAIITFQRAHNYGSILQAYALQHYIKSSPNVEMCKILDFSNQAQRNMYAVYHPVTSIKYLIKNVLAFFMKKEFVRQDQDFDLFIERWLDLTKQTYKTADEMRGIDEFDAYFAGSDQIWNICCIDADDAYFLNFVENRPKYAYAPSFGAQNINECAENPAYYRDLISQFRRVSIREKNGQKWMQQLLGYDVPLLIDPTMFYDKSFWSQYMALPQECGKYILYYSFGFTQEINRAVKKISKRLGLPVILLNVRAWVYKTGFLYGFKYAKHSGPAEFLRYVNDAEIILSNSFHGTVFSALFEKNFWYLVGSEHNEQDDRAKTMVEQIGIGDRMLQVGEIDDCDFRVLPDYGKVRANLRELRKSAFEYLDECLSDIDEAGEMRHSCE